MLIFSLRKRARIQRILFEPMPVFAKTRTARGMLKEAVMRVYGLKKLLVFHLPVVFKH